MDRQRDHAGYPQDNPNDIIRDLVMAGAPDEELIAAATIYAVEGKTIERVITTALDHHLPLDVCLRQQVRWYRRAVNDNQIWAMYEAGTLWSLDGSDDSRRSRQLTNDMPPNAWKQESLEPTEIPKATNAEIELNDFVSAEEARQWIVQAAEHGLRRACLEAACWNLDDERAAGWLRTAFGDGDGDTELGRHELAATALWLARVLDKVGDPEAGTWYRTAVECPPWSVSDDYGASWVEAVCEYALWAHKQGDERLCTAWAYRLLENAADSGPDDRNYLESEYKTYRYAWQMARDAEFARHQIMHHLLTEHELPAWQKLEIALLLRNDRRFGQETWDVVRIALDAQTMKSLTLSRFVTVGMARHARVLDVPITIEHAWATISWLLEEAVPAVFRFVGLEQDATNFARLVPADLRRADLWEWQSEVERFEDGKELTRSMESLSYPDGILSFDRTAQRFVADVVTRAGLGERRSLFKTLERDYHEDFAELGLTSSRWVLLRGDPAWLGMYCATAAEGTADQWMAWWNCASGIVTSTIMGALLTLGRELNIDWTARIAFNDPIKDLWRELGDTFERSSSLFLERAGGL